jgi:hypothetical protein
MPRPAPLSPLSPPFSFIVYYDGPLPLVCTGFVTLLLPPAARACISCKCIPTSPSLVVATSSVPSEPKRLQTAHRDASGLGCCKGKGSPHEGVWGGGRNRALHSFLSWTLEAGEWSSSPPLNRIGSWVDPKPGLNLPENKKNFVPLLVTLQAGRSRVPFPVVSLEFLVDLIPPTAQ